MSEGVVAYVALGSNLEDPVSQVRGALRELEDIPASRVLAVSGLYLTAPVGPQDQDDFVNAAAALETSLAPLELLEALQSIEQRHHRRRLRRWGPRTLDLDLLLYGDLIIRHPRLAVPHPEMKKRAFVLLPLADVAPDLALPDGSRVRDLLSGVDASGCRTLSGDGGS
ncbi:MAG: 2-amino-4-hydroxy-6-hydroxymethyldihydropteridine diphosphokinase [Succinivibrionaceae bacterium]|nr:2-amino-4-hydroxy-6-hydroxymethyldihydropteridine diphosphokinase [Succinivibrionaceae bacterium]